MSPLFRERIAPYLLAGLVLLVYLAVLKQAPRGDTITGRVVELVGEVGAIAAVLVGFISTVGAILYALPDRPFVRRVAQMGVLTKLIGYIKTATLWGFCTLGLGLLLQVSDGVLPARVHSWAVAVWVFVAALAFASFFRAARLVAKLLEYTMSAVEQD